MATSFAAAPPRVACPACGNAVHPIAGRCRHCRIDLLRARADGAHAATSAAPPAASPALRPRTAFVAALGLAIAIALVVRFVIAGAAAPPGM